VSAAAQARLVLIGQPQTGKSTFLGAFWALVDSPAERSVREARFSGDRSYIQRLAEQVARGEELERTPLDAEESLAVALEFESDGLVDLVIPDTSGESVRILLERRIWPEGLLAACENATAILVFIHPQRIRLPSRVAVSRRAADRGSEHLGVDPDDGGALDSGVERDAVADRPDVAFQYRHDAATAAELVDLFENLSDFFRGRWPIRVGVIVSAWDTIAGDPKPTPHQWLESRLPAVLATLESNPDAFDFEAFGVSAQGGPLEARGALLAIGEICDRVHAEDRSGRRIALVEPVRWAIWGS
jgi:hypothetical protein